MQHLGAKKVASPIYGWGYGLLAAISGSIFVISGKFLSLTTNTISGVGVIFFVASIFSGLLLLIEKQRKLILNRKSISLLVTLTIISLIGNAVGLETLRYLKPSVSQVLQRTEVIFTIIFSVLLLKESISTSTWVGGILAIIGIYLVDINHIEYSLAGWIGILYSISYAILFSLFQIFVKQVLPMASPNVINFIRQVGTTIIIIPIILPNIKVLSINESTWFWGIISAITGPVLARVCLIYALKHISVSKVAMAMTSSPIFSATFEYYFLNSTFGIYEVLGSVIIVTGILICIAYSK